MKEISESLGLKANSSTLPLRYNDLFMLQIKTHTCFYIYIHRCANAQKQKKADKISRDNLQAHIKYLADDKLEGRRAGSPGEKLAMEYISDKFKTIGLLAKGSDGYYQPFEINEGLQINEGNIFYN